MKKPNLLFLLLSALLIQANLASFAWADHDTQPTGELAKTREKAEAGLCAAPAAPAPAPAAPISSQQAGKTEAETCVDCQNGVKPGTPIPAIATQPLVQLTEEEKKRVVRDLAFMRWYDKKAGRDYYEQDRCATVSLCEETIKMYKDYLAEHWKQVETYRQHATKMKAAVTDLDNVFKGQALPSATKQTIKDDLAREIPYAEQRIQSLKSNIEYMKKYYANQYSASEKKYQEEQLAKSERERDQKKALLEWVNGPADKAPADQAAFDALKKKYTDNAAAYERRAESTSKELTGHEKDLKGYEEKLIALKSPKPQTPVAPAESFEAQLDELTKLEQKHKGRVLTRNQGYKPCGMTVAEQLALNYYTGDGYKGLNKALREGGNAAEEMKPFREVLLAALAKLGNFEGDVKRGADLPANVLAEYKEGAILTMAAYTSTSFANGFNSRHRFVIRSRDGKYIAPYSSSYSEYEVLFAEGARFKVLSRKDDAYGRVEIVMEQVLDGPTASPSGPVPAAAPASP